MPNTGERDYIEVMPENMAEWYMHLVHIASYEYAAQLSIGKQVLDYGCGSGYGSAILASKAKAVTGVDLSDEAIAYAREHHAGQALEFRSLAEYQPRQGFYDLITSFQVIEHVKDLDAYLQTIHHQLAPGGLALISTPNRDTRLYPFQKPWNIWHLTEYSPRSLEKLLSKYFSTVEILHITSNPELINAELLRTQRLRLMALPATLAIYPEFLRRILLNLQSGSFELLKKLLTNKSGQIADNDTPRSFPYQSSDIRIIQGPCSSSDLMAVCRKKK